MRVDKVFQVCFAAIALLTPFVLIQGTTFEPPPIPIAQAVTQPEPAPPESEEVPRRQPLDPVPRIHIQFSESQQFGIVCPRIRALIDPGKPKRLTGDERGSTNNTVIRIDGRDYLFGSKAPGARWISMSVSERGVDDGPAWEAVWELEFGLIRVIQSLDLVMTG
jgi:hypothetical protein